MRYAKIVAASLLIAMAALGLSVATARAEGNVHKVNHVIVIMQENHSFDNYLGALPYAPGSPYHAGACKNSDHSCVDGLTCTFDALAARGESGRR
jgi:phospholipase C